MHTYISYFFLFAFHILSSSNSLKIKIEKKVITTKFQWHTYGTRANCKIKSPKPHFRATKSNLRD